MSGRVGERGCCDETFGVILRETASSAWEEGIFENSTVDKSLHSSEEVPEHYGLRSHQRENESGHGALRQGQVLVQRVSPRACTTTFQSRFVVAVGGPIRPRNHGALYLWA